MGHERVIVRKHRAKQDRNPSGKRPNPVALSLVYEGSVSKEFLDSSPPTLLYIKTVLTYASSTLCMPHVSDISNILGTCGIFVSIVLRKIHINSYSGSNSLHSHSQQKSVISHPIPFIHQLVEVEADTQS